MAGFRLHIHTTTTSAAGDLSAGVVGRFSGRMPNALGPALGGVGRRRQASHEIGEGVGLADEETHRCEELEGSRGCRVRRTDH